ncbi:acyl carrier protein [Alcanivorax sp.]|uniref:acyl carrier protein n=1 Tax=Alcanivorax sp. TaxID=1872427 RepID=UPI0026181314|nr:phosphopantetheine-binding protein [Alcanivorax sp.]
MNKAEAKKIVVSVIENNVLGLEMSDEKMNQTLVDLGVDSLDVMIVIMDVAEATGVEISDDQVDELETPQKIIDFITS